MNADVVDVELPVRVDLVPTLRLITASLAARCNLTSDDIEDVRLAIDEACAVLSPLVNSGVQLRCRFELTQNTIVVHLFVTTGSPATPDHSALSWLVLEALTDSVDSRHDAGKLTIAMTKHRSA